MRFRLSSRFRSLRGSKSRTAEEAQPRGASPDEALTESLARAPAPDEARTQTTTTRSHSDQAPTESISPVAAVAPVVVPRWIQLVVLPLSLLGLWALARAAGVVLLILIAAATFALILNPVVKMIHRRRIPRGLAILLVYLALLAALVGIGVLLANPVGNQVARFERNVPSIIHNANHVLADVQNWLDRHGLRIQIRHQGQSALQTLERDVLKNSGSVVSFTRDLLGKLVSIAFDLVLVVVLSVYLLVYGREIRDLVRRVMPPGDGTPADDYPLLVQRAVFGYVRGQLLFSVVMGSSAALCLWIIGTIGIFPDGARYALFFGGFYGVMELVPYIGPILGALPAVLVALFTDPITAVWVILLFVGLQQLEGHVVAPQVFRISLRINPIVIILSLLIGYQLYGIPGALVALPVAAVIRETVIYLRRHLVLESWGGASVGAGLVSPPPPSAKEGGEPRDQASSDEPGDRLPPVPGEPNGGDHGGLPENPEGSEVPVPGYRITPD